MEQVEQPNPDVRVRIQHVDLIVHVEVVEQQAYAHALIRCPQQVLRNQPAGRVVVEDVVLQVDRVLRVVSQRNATHQGVVAECEQAEAGWVEMLVSLGMDVASARRTDGRWQRLRRLLDEVAAHQRARAE